MKRLIFPSILLIASFFLLSCGPSLTEITQSLLEQGKNDEALARMKRAILLDPKEPEYRKLKGIAHYNRGEFKNAIKEFETVLKYDDEDDQAAYYLGASYENLKQFDRAIQYYRLYTELTFYGEFKETVEARIKLLYRQQMEQEAQRALQTENQLDVAKVPSNTVAILYFENKGKKTEYDPLQKGLAEMIITDLSKVKALKIVERIRLQKLIEEMNLGETDLVDPKTAPRLGKLLGAYRLIKGSFFELQQDKVNIDAFVARTKTGALDVTTNISGKMENFFRLEKDLVFNILDEMKIKISDNEREAILEIPTENFFAFLQYSRGLELEDQGLYAQASQAYSQAVQADPSFTQAKTNATSAKNAEQIIESSTSGTQSQNSTSTENSNQQSSSSGKSSPSKASSTFSNNPGLVPSSSPLNRPGSGSVVEMLSNLGNTITNNLNPGSGNQNQPPPVIRAVLPTPPLPPGK
ncbi:MAG: tetratricopeptide repeat protein [Bacteroidota bacterium]|jgi:tetratricopeptide (TPR) repeat protein